MGRQDITHTTHRVRSFPFIPLLVMRKQCSPFSSYSLSSYHSPQDSPRRRRSRRRNGWSVMESARAAGGEAA